ncbi:MAG: protein kinase, partial [Aeromonas salmonicida]
VAVKLFKGAVTSDGLPNCEMAASLAAGTHPNLIRVLGKVADHPSGMPALVMELIDPTFANLAGPPSLDSCTRDVYPAGLSFTPAAVLAMAQGIAAAAGHLHERGIMHGDLYGHNILHSFQGKGRVLLGDFGAASCYDRTECVLAEGLERIEVRAFGCLLDELLARCQPQSEALQDLALLARACLCEQVLQRPSFAQISARITAVTAMMTAEPVCA